MHSQLDQDMSMHYMTVLCEQGLKCVFDYWAHAKKGLKHIIL